MQPKENYFKSYKNGCYRELGRVASQYRPATMCLLLSFLEDSQCVCVCVCVQHPLPMPSPTCHTPHSEWSPSGAHTNIHTPPTDSWTRTHTNTHVASLHSTPAKSCCYQYPQESTYDCL